MLDELIKSWMSFRQIQLLIKNRERAKNVRKENADLANKIDITENTNLNDIKWIGQVTRKTLLENWIKNKDDLAWTSMEKIKELITSPIAFKAIKNFFNKSKDNTKSKD